MTSGMLSGYTILDLTSVVLGPFATQILGDMGADVIKIETPGGDIMRHAGPMRSEGMGPIYMTINRNKRAMTLDITKPDAKRILRQLVSKSDVLFHNIRAAGMKRLGFDYDQVKAIKEDIVYVHAVGFGSDGHYAGRQAYDDLVQAASGLTTMLPRQDGSKAPRYIPGLVADKTTGLFAANAILASLLHRERTGRGQFVEVPMMECMVAFNMVENLFGYTFVPPAGQTAYSRSVSPNRKPYATKDGYIAIMPYSDENWRRFFELGGRSDLVEDPRFKTYAARNENIDDIYRLLSEIAPQRTTDDWMDVLKEANVPCMRVHSLDSVLEDPQIKDTGLTEVRNHPSEGNYLAIHHPVKYSDSPMQVDREPPKQGADTDEILGGLGWTEEEIAMARNNGAFG